MNEREKFFSEKRYKNRPIVVECKYIGKWSIFKDLKKWHKYKAYKNVSVAEIAMKNLNRKSQSFEFRIRN